MTETAPVWIDQQDALALHGRLLALHGGAEGVRDFDLRQSALARPRQLMAYGVSVDIIDMADAYTAAIVRNHPFVDGNKRIGFVVGVLFLEMNFDRFTEPEDETAEAVIGLAAGVLDEAGSTAFLRRNVEIE